jgi:SSS family solute:Na+ symporter
MAFAHWELHSWLVLVLGWVFAPFYLRARVFTTPEFLERRYNPATRTLLSAIFLAAYVLTKASVTIFAGAFAIQTILGYETINLPLFGEVDFFWFSAAFLVIITGVFVIAGGMLSVLWTEAMHVPVLLAGSAVLLIVGLHEVGGWDAMIAANPENLHLWRPLSTTTQTQGFPNFLFEPDDKMPWLGVLLCSPIIGLWYWCTDQYIVQRVLSARGLKEARRGTIFAAYLKLAPVFIFLIPGMIAVALYQQKFPGFESIGNSPQGAFPVLVSNLLPIGLRGLVLAGMLSALMSALASLFNSTATLFTVDFYKRLKPQSSEQHLVFVGRVATAAVVVIGMVWIPIMRSMSDQLYSYLQVVQSLLAPGIAAVFMAGIFSRRVTPISGLVGLATGFAIGMLRLLLQVLHKSGGIDFPGPIQAIVDVNWLYFSFLLFVFTCVVVFVVSAFTPKASPGQIAGLTYRSVSAQQSAEDRQSYGLWELFHTAVIVGIIVTIYVYFW